METIKPVTKKEKQKDKPKIGAGTKDEKRKQKKEKLMKELQMKKEAQQPVPEAPPVQPATFGNDFSEMLARISLSPNTGESLTEKGKKKRTTEQVAQMKNIYASIEFNANPIFRDVDKQLTMKTQARAQQGQFEEAKRIQLEKLNQK